MCHSDPKRQVYSNAASRSQRLAWVAQPAKKYMLEAVVLDPPCCKLYIFVFLETCQRQSVVNFKENDLTIHQQPAIAYMSWHVRRVV